MIQGWMNNQRAALLASMPKPEQREEGVQVLVARKALPAGTLVKPDHLEWRAWPEDGIVKDYTLKGKGTNEPFLGAVVRKGLAAGEPITVQRVVKPGERGFLAAVLQPGRRAISVPINATSGIAGFVFPGDRVDLLLTHQYQSGEGRGRQANKASETVLMDVRVLAVDQTTNDQNGQPIIAKTATLEVTPRQAELVSVAVQLGKLSLSLRSLQANVAEAKKPDDSRAGSRGRTYTRDWDVSRVISGADANTVVITVIRGNEVQSNKLKVAPPQFKASKMKVVPQ